MKLKSRVITATEIEKSVKENMAAHRKRVGAMLKKFNRGLEEAIVELKRIIKAREGEDRSPPS